MIAAKIRFNSTIRSDLVTSEEKLARIAANRVLLKMADDEIMRIKKES